MKYVGLAIAADFRPDNNIHLWSEGAPGFLPFVFHSSAFCKSRRSLWRFDSCERTSSMSSIYLVERKDQVVVSILGASRGLHSFPPTPVAGCVGNTLSRPGNRPLCIRTPGESVSSSCGREEKL